MNHQSGNTLSEGKPQQISTVKLKTCRILIHNEIAHYAVFLVTLIGAEEAEYNQILSKGTIIFAVPSTTLLTTCNDAFLFHLCV